MTKEKAGADSRRRALYSVLALVGLPLTFVAGGLSEVFIPIYAVSRALTIAFYVIPPPLLLICLVADRKLRRSAKSFPGVVIMVYMLIEAMLVPSILPSSSPAKRNELSAISALRTIHTAQMQYQEKAAIDVDDDGIADFGTLKQLQETTPHSSITDSRIVFA